MKERETVRVWHVDSGRRPGGGQIQISYLVRGLAERGVACTLVCPPGSPLDRLHLPAEVSVIHLSLRGEWDLWSARRLKRLVRSHQPDILHAHDARSHTICLLARGPNQRIIVHRRVCFAIRQHPLTAWKYGRGVDHFIAVAECVREQLFRAQVPNEKISVIHSAVDLSRFSDDRFRVESGQDREALLIGTVGRLSKEKRHGWLLETLVPVLRERPSVRVVLVGTGPERPRLERLANRLGISQQVIFAGHQDDVRHLLFMFDVFVLCSESEGYPVSLAEAMAAGCAVISTDVGGAREIVTPGRDGVLVPGNDAGAFRDAIRELLADESRRTALGRAARQTACWRCGTEPMVDMVLDLYNEVLGQRGQYPRSSACPPSGLSSAQSRVVRWHPQLRILRVGPALRLAQDSASCRSERLEACPTRRLRCQSRGRRPGKKATG